MLNGFHCVERFRFFETIDNEVSLDYSVALSDVGPINCPFLIIINYINNINNVLSERATF